MLNKIRNLNCLPSQRKRNFSFHFPRVEMRNIKMNEESTLYNQTALICFSPKNVHLQSTLKESRKNTLLIRVKIVSIYLKKILPFLYF